MFSQQSPVNSPCLRVLLFALAGSGALAGCANPGQPRPPSLRLPEKAQKLAAERVADRVLLTWTTPEKTTDKEFIRGAVTAVVCRDITSLKAGAPAVSCVPVQRTPVQPGTIHTETMPLDVTAGVPTLLTYRVELQNARGHSAGPSDPIFAAGGAAPPALGALAVSGRREGAQIAWIKTTKTTGNASVRLVRTQIAPAPERRPDKNAQPLSFTHTTTQATVVELKTPDRLDADPGGLIDPTAQNGYTYSYVGERVAAVTLSGHLLEMHSEPSAAAPFTYRDVFPPHAPVGLVSIPGGGFGQPASVDLSWDANLESDLLGYNVYRKDAAGGDFTRLNPEPVPASAFRDLTAQSGHSYIYRVTAVDQRHNESLPGDEIHETLRK